MSKGKVLLLLVVVAMAAGAGGALLGRHYLGRDVLSARGRQTVRLADDLLANRESSERYSVSAHCTNCGWEGKVQVPKGESVEKVACPRCEKWTPPKPNTARDYAAEEEAKLGISSDAALEAEADRIAAERTWVAERTSSLMTRDRWELRKAYIASGGRL